MEHFHTILFAIIAMAFGAAGNRLWGWEHGSRECGIVCVTSGIVIVNPDLIWWAPVFAGLYWIFRFRGTGEGWLAFHTNRNRMKAILRGVWIMPLAIFITYMTDEWWHMLVAIWAFPLCAYAYRFSHHDWKLANPTAVAECFVGAFVVAVTI